MEFRLLGPLEVLHDGEPVRLGGPRERAVLAALLLRANRLASIGYLVDVVWDRPPASPETNLRTYLTGLRRRLGTDRLTTSPGGYRLEVRPGELDLTEFEAACARGLAALDDGRYADADTAFVDALDRFRDEPLTGTTYGAALQAEVARLTERRIDAVEGYARARLDRGAGAELIDELAGFVEQYPLRENLWMLLMLALHRAGRRADALNAYRRARDVLARQLGIDPGSALTRMHEQLLAGDPALDELPRPTTSTAPAQLPADLARFAGRADELAELTARLDAHEGAPVALITALDGMAGIGKTALATRFAHRVRARFPDGQIFLDLHAHTADIEPVEPADALDRILRTLGVPGTRIPPDLDGRAALYRSQLADRRMLIVLDNAASERQVTPLLPGTAGSLVLLTSRRSLGGLDNVVPIRVDVLPDEDAIGLFRGIVGEGRTDDVPTETIGDLVRLCGQLPLAIRIAAARLRDRPRWTVEHLADRLRNEHRRLAELTMGERSVAGAFALSYRDLPADQKRMFRLLGLHPGADIEPHAAAALADVSVTQAEQLLEQLVDAHLLTEREAGRYVQHDLLREHAGSTALRTEPAADRQAALTRLLDHYSHASAVAMTVLHPHETDRRPRIAAAAHATRSFHDPAAAIGWLDAELANLRAAVVHAAREGWPRQAVQLSQLLHRHLRARNHFHDALVIHSEALRAAEIGLDRPGMIDALRGLADAYRLVARYAEATAHYERMLELAREIPDPVREGWALHGLGTVHRVCGRAAEATECYRAALGIARRLGDRTNERLLLVSMGNAALVAGRRADAVEYYRQGLDIARQIGDRTGESHALNGIGLVHHLNGESRLALDHHQQAADIAAQVGERLLETQALVGLGIARRSTGQLETSMDCLRRALRLAAESGDRNGRFEALLECGHTLHAAADFDAALRHHTDALALASALGQLHDEGRAHAGIAQARFELGDLGAARAHWQRALTIYARLDAGGQQEIAEQLEKLDAQAADRRRS